jgi:hypothetical protein
VSSGVPDGSMYDIVPKASELKAELAGSSDRWGERIIALKSGEHT